MSTTISAFLENQEKYYVGTPSYLELGGGGGGGGGRRENFNV